MNNSGPTRHEDPGRPTPTPRPGTRPRAESRLIKDLLQCLIAAGRPAQEANLARLAEHWGEPGSGGQGVGGGEAANGACLGYELSREDGPHAGQAPDEGCVRVAGEPGLERTVELGQALAGSERLGGEFADEHGGHALTR